MGKVLHVIAKIISSLLVVLLVAVLPASILIYDIYRVVFNPPVMKQVLTEIVVESDLIPVALEWYSDRRAQQRAAASDAIVWVDEPDVVQLMEFLKRDEWRQIKTEILPNEILADWVSVTVDGVYVWIDSDDRIPQITWKLQTFKDRVNSQHGTNCIQIVYDTLKPCVQEQIDDFLKRLDAAPVGKEVPYNLCQFPEPWIEDQFSDYHESLVGVVKQVPPQFALTEELAQVEDVAGVGPEKLKQQLRLTRTLARLAPLATLILMLLILAFGVRSWKELGKRWGIPILLGGLIFLGLAFFYAPLIVALLGRGPLSEVPPLVMQEAQYGILRLGRVIFAPAKIQAAVVILVGLILTILGIVLKRKRRDEEEPEREDEQVVVLEEQEPRLPDSEA